jgi:membrane protease YdiL (CAAX protease family)
VPLWTLGVAAAPAFVFAYYRHDLELSPVLSERMYSGLVWGCMFAWWVLKAAPRPLSLRSTLGRPPALAGWALAPLLLVAVSCVRLLVWLAPPYWAAVQAGTFVLSSVDVHISSDYPTLLEEVVVSVILAPIGEELIFRGTIFRKWRVLFVPAIAALLSSLAFGAMHAEKLVATIMGVTLVLLYTRTQSLWVPILLHISNNGMAAVLNHCWNGQLRFEGPWRFGTFVLILLLGAAFWLHFAHRSWRTLGTPLPPDSLGDAREEQPAHASAPAPVVDA